MATEDKWSAADEALLADLTARRAAFLEKNKQPLFKALADSGLTTGPGQRPLMYGDQIVDAMILHADAFRDALAPFDSGVRPAKAANLPAAPLPNVPGKQYLLDGAQEQTR